MIHLPGGSDFDHFYSHLDRLLFTGEGKVSIVHFGGSHLQADVYTHHTRTLLQNMQSGLNGGRGVVFPASVLGSNNSISISATSTGNWYDCRNTERNKNCNLGVTGMMVSTNDSVATLTIMLKDPGLQYETTCLRVFYYDPTDSYSLTLNTPDPYLINAVEYQPGSGYADIILNHPRDTFELEFYKTNSEPAVLEFYGVELKNDYPGIVYHTSGVNGASIPSYLRCNLLKEQMNILNPDLVIISLGTNDGFSKSFNPEVYYRHYKDFIAVIREACPDVDILLTVPNDVYFHRRRVNRNTVLQEEVIYQLAIEEDCAIWNFFQVMGGLNSVPEWYSRGLMRRDRIHFTREGYLLKGDLFFQAMINSYGQYLENKSIGNISRDAMENSYNAGR